MLINNFSLFMTTFTIGLIGLVMNQKNILIMLMSLEMIFLSVSYNFVYSSLFLDDISGQMFATLILTVAAAESSVGTAMLVIYYRIRHSITMEFMCLLKG
uniref:NADH dehydrogenase subunit 4L n=1 Tax=Bostrychia tenuissima TaxID=196631 RepID=UPI002E75CF70|nr:NADH dehydrogenase subunit 4L [Bostrychia tenuissima]WQF69429.1 NADH dehydrogenase subunit 4L [Bostrychia tenuissima]